MCPGVFVFFYLEPFFIDDFAGVERSHGVNLHNRFEGIEGQSGGRTQEVPCGVCTDTQTKTEEKKNKAFQMTDKEKIDCILL